MSTSNITRELVTGTAGFIGSHVVDRLVPAGYVVRVVDNLSTMRLDNNRGHLDRSSVDSVKADIRDFGVGRFVKDVDAVVHSAAIVSVPFSAQNHVLGKIEFQSVFTVHKFFL